MFLLVGLGNPTPRYDRTRHNAGFMFLDFLREAWGFPEWLPGERCVQSEGEYGGGKILMIKPLTYMNLSGESAGAIARYRRIDPAARVLAIADDVSMEFGKLRLRDSGSAGGHNGLKSLIAHFGTDGFSRLKIGIGHDSRVPLENWVLMPFAKDEEKALGEEIFPRARTITEEWLATRSHPS
jgi:peptidyl-tRNA hydrolase, PTH1 family